MKSFISGISCCCKLLIRSHTGYGTARKLIDSRRCSLQCLAATKAEGNIQRILQSRNSRSIRLNHFNERVGSTTIINRNKLEFHETIPCYGLAKEVNPDEWPACIIVFDLGTTGCSLEIDRVTDFAARDLRGGTDSTFETFVNPDRVILNLDVCGISTHTLGKPNVPRFKELIPAFEQYVLSRQIEGKPVLFVAHNARKFDVPFLINEYRRSSGKAPPDFLYLDTLSLARELVKPDGSKLVSLSLKALREHYGIPLIGPGHTAMRDVITSSYVLQHITHDLKLTPQELIEMAFRASDIARISHRYQSSSL